MNKINIVWILGLLLSSGCTQLSSGRDDTEMVAVDGLQRITAVTMEGKLRPTQCRFNLRVLDITREQQLQLYIDHNAGGTPHAAHEIKRVAKLLEAEKRRQYLECKKDK